MVGCFQSQETCDAPCHIAKFDFNQVKGDLAALCQSKVRGRQNGREITLFKSCGTALEDLAAAVMVYLHQTA